MKAAAIPKIKRCAALPDDGSNNVSISAISYCVSTIDFQKNNFAALSVGNSRKRPIPSLLPCEMNFLKVYIRSLLDFKISPYLLPGALLYVVIISPGVQPFFNNVIQGAELYLWSDVFAQ